MHLRREEVTIAKVLQRAGYDTCHSGKWHLAGVFNKPEQPQPGEHGFNHWFSTFNNAGPTHENPVNFFRNGRKVGPQTGFSCQLVVDEAIGWLKDHRNPDKPFFLYTCFHETHEKVASPANLISKYSSVAKKKGEDLYFANVTNMDQAVGRLLATLDELKLSEDTLVWFMSDHGPEITNLYPEAWRSHGSAGPFRGKKRSLHEGGIRVPGIIRWKGHIASGQTIGTPVSSVDLFPTCCELAHVPLPADRPMDGTSIAPLLSGRSLPRTQPLFWHFYAGSEHKPFALRDGDWKLVARSEDESTNAIGDKLQVDSVPRMKRARLTGFELYNLADDVGEQHDVAAREPERLKALSAKAEKIYGDVLKEAPDWRFD
jgi:arylsulfatase A